MVFEKSLVGVEFLFELVVFICRFELVGEMVLMGILVKFFLSNRVHNLNIFLPTFFMSLFEKTM